MKVVVDHNHWKIRRVRNMPRFAKNKYNGGYYYSLEIAKYFIPAIKTDRNWVTMNIKSEPGVKHSIVFAHNNIHTEWYEKYKGLDAVLVCGMPETVEKLKAYGEAIYLPLSVDVEYVSRFRTEKTKDVCFVGRAEKKADRIPDDVPCLEGIPREELLSELAKFRKAYAVDRCAIECKILGTEVLQYGYGYGVEHTPDFWKVVDSREAAAMLQAELNRIDGKE